MAIVGVLAMAGAVTGCGGEDESAADVTRPADPVYCPSAVDDMAAGTFDARDVLGQSLGDAERTAKDHDCMVRVVAEDGEDLPQTMDLRIERINVEVRDGVVVALRGVG